MSSLAIFGIKIYQNTLGLFMPGRCRFHPTCSEYALECFSTFGFFKALGKSAYRIARCNPFSEGYFDPVVKNHSCGDSHSK